MLTNKGIYIYYYYYYFKFLKKIPAIFSDLGFSLQKCSKILEAGFLPMKSWFTWSRTWIIGSEFWDLDSHWIETWNSRTQFGASFVLLAKFRLKEELKFLNFENEVLWRLLFAISEKIFGGGVWIARFPYFWFEMCSRKQRRIIKYLLAISG